MVIYKKYILFSILFLLGCGGILTDGKERTNIAMKDYLIKNFSAFDEANKTIIKFHFKNKVRIDDNWTSPGDLSKAGVSKKELDEIRIKLKKIQIPRGVFIDDDYIEYYSFSFGLPSGGKTQGYIFTLKNLSNFEDKKTKKEICYITNNWYSFNQYDQ